MHAEIVMIGTELLLGEIVDTNANRLAKALREIGLDLYYKTTVGDNETRITEILNLALDRSDVIITSGGIGPTVDDVTRQAVANATGRKLIYSTDLEAQIAARFRIMLWPACWRWYQQVPPVKAPFRSSQFLHALRASKISIEFFSRNYAINS